MFTFLPLNLSFKINSLRHLNDKKEMSLEFFLDFFQGKLKIILQVLFLKFHEL